MKLERARLRVFHGGGSYPNPKGINVLLRNKLDREYDGRFRMTFYNLAKISEVIDQVYWNILGGERRFLRDFNLYLNLIIP